MLGQPVSMLIPQVVGFKLHGQLREGATATDVVLTVDADAAQEGRRRKIRRVSTARASRSLALPDRATIANMAPEYGATMGFFPVDEETLDYLTFSGRDPEQVKLVEAYCKEQGLFHTAKRPSRSSPTRSSSTSAPSSRRWRGRSGRRIACRCRRSRVVADKTLDEMCEKGPDLAARKKHTEKVQHGDVSFELGHGAVVIAAITSCTNTSNPAVMLGAGLLAKKAIGKRGLTQSKPWVKTSLAPGSRVVTEYLKEAGLLPYLEGLGFHLVGYGCTTCIGNSGPLPEPIAEAVTKGDLVVAAVLSGNRNFEGRINALVRMNFLASPMLVVAYALAGSVDIDLQNDPLGARQGRQAGLPARHLADERADQRDDSHGGASRSSTSASTARSSTATSRGRS